MAIHQRITKEQVANPANKIPKPVVTETASRSPVISPVDSIQTVTANLNNYSHVDIFTLQRTLGNRAVGTMLRGSVGQHPVIQAKNLGFKQAHDKYEIESIRATEQNRPLPDQLKTGIESLSGLSMDDVKVHHNSTKPKSIQAHAYTQGTDIHLAPQQEKYLPHELWHVVQQKQGRVQPSRNIDGLKVNLDESLEKEADEMSTKALQISQFGNAISNIQLSKLLPNLRTKNSGTQVGADFSEGHKVNCKSNSFKSSNPDQVIQQVRDKDKDPRRVFAKMQRDKERKKTKIRQERQFQRDNNFDQEEFPTGKVAIRGERRNRQREERAENARQNEMMDFAITERENTFRDDLSTINTARDQGIQDVANRLQMMIKSVDASLPEVTQGLTKGKRMKEFLNANAQAPLVVTHITNLESAEKRFSDLKSKANKDLTNLNNPEEINAGELYEIKKRLNSVESENSELISNKQAANSHIKQLEQTHQAQLQIANTHPSLKLTKPILDNPQFRPQLYTTGNLTLLNSKIKNATVTNWQAVAGWPSTRNGVRPNGMSLPVLMPQIFVAINDVQIYGEGKQNLNLELGPEIIVDWIFQNPGHGIPFDKLIENIKMVADPKHKYYQQYKPTIVKQGNGNYLGSSINFNFKLVLNSSKNMVITYFGLN